MQQIVYVASPGSQQLHVFALAQTGAMQLLQVVPTPGQVQPLVISPDGHWLYAGVRPEFAVVSYRIGEDGHLHEQGSAPLAGSASHTATDATGRFFFAASYAFNHVTVSAMDAQGRVQAPHQRLDDLMAAHSVTLLPYGQSNQELLVACLKEAAIRRYRLKDDGRLVPHPLGGMHTASGAGPRHLALHPSNGDIYCLNELDGTVNRYHREPDGCISERQSLDMLPTGYEGPRWGADIHITPNGRFLYSSERASSLLTLFRVDEQEGSLTPVAHIPTETQPRGFAIDTSGHYLIGSGELSDHIALYGIDQQTGALELLSRHPVGKGAMWVRVLDLAERARTTA